MSYILKRGDIYDFAASGHYETREKGGELEFRFCPYCNGGKRRDDWTFSVNLESGAYKCFRASCGQQGHFVELCRDFGFRLEFEAPKIYKQLPQVRPESKAAAIKYLEGRGISSDVVRQFRVTVRKDNPNILVFPFYDETGKLVFVKYRKTDFQKGVDKNKEWSEKDTMPILFGMDQCRDFDRLIITEGQIDTLSVVEVGFHNVVSVPTGATGFTWLTHTWAWLTQFKEIVVFGDCERGKVTLVDTLSARLPKEILVKAVRVEDYLGEKDANDILCRYGAPAIVKCIQNAQIPELDNVKQLADVQTVDITKMDQITTGILDLDKVIHGMAMGQLVILTGKRGEGKSTFMSQLVCEALDQKRTVFVYSGELADFHFKRWLDYQLAGRYSLTERVNRYGDTDYVLDDETVEKISEWYRDRAYIYDNNYIGAGNEFESLPDTIEKVILKYNAQLICVDNLMTAMEAVHDNNNLYLAQSNFVGRLKAIATKYSVVIVLVAHPKKPSKDNWQDENDLVAGSSDITNKADIVLKYSRVDGAPDGADGSIKVTKNRIMGTLRMKEDNAIRVRYSPASRRITALDETSEKIYGWEKIAAGMFAAPEDMDLPWD